MQRVLIPGNHGFIGRQLSKAIPTSTDREVSGRDRQTDRIAEQPAGAPFQHLQQRVPAIACTMRDFGWASAVGRTHALARIVESCRSRVASARALVG